MKISTRSSSQQLCCRNPKYLVFVKKKHPQDYCRFYSNLTICKGLPSSMLQSYTELMQSLVHQPPLPPPFLTCATLSIPLCPERKQLSALPQTSLHPNATNLSLLLSYELKSQNKWKKISKMGSLRRLYYMKTTWAMHRGQFIPTGPVMQRSVPLFLETVLKSCALFHITLTSLSHSVCTGSVNWSWESHDRLNCSP